MTKDIGKMAIRSRTVLIKQREVAEQRRDELIQEIQQVDTFLASVDGIIGTIEQTFDLPATGGQIQVIAKRKQRASAKKPAGKK